MAASTTSTGFPLITILVFSAIQIFTGLFSFIFSCIVLNSVTIMLGILFMALGIFLLLIGTKVLNLMETNVPMVVMVVVFSAIINFIQFVYYCQLARIYSYMVGYYSGSAYLGVSIVLILLLVGLICFSVFLTVLLLKHHQSNTMTNSPPTTVTTTSTTHTTIETPPAMYMNQPNSQVPK